MRLPIFAVRAIRSFIFDRTAARRKPDLVIGEKDNPYLRRWYVIPRNPFFNVYFHIFHRPDDDRAMHDHPWWSMSLLLAGWYIERTPKASYERRAGDIAVRGGKSLHAIDLYRVGDGSHIQCWTLFFTGPRYREWGFQCRDKWVHWEDFTNREDGGATVGAGCDGPASVPGTKKRLVSNPTIQS